MTTELILLSQVSYRGQEITGPRMRGLLALLAADLRTGCSAAGLMEGLWPDRQPENPVKALQVLVSRARAQLGPGVIDSTPAGYRLSLSGDQVDASAVLLSASASARYSRAWRLTRWRLRTLRLASRCGMAPRAAAPCSMTRCPRCALNGSRRIGR